MKVKVTVYVNDIDYRDRFALEEYLVGNDIEYRLTRSGNFSAWLTKEQIETLMDGGHNVHVW
jgi:hypothetical protein